MIEEIKIETGIPIPTQKTHFSGIRATLRKLKIGESFVTNSRRRYSVAASAKSVGIKITVATLEDDPATVRVWRIE